jgi:transcription elongation factor Elf1
MPVGPNDYEDDEPRPNPEGNHTEFDCPSCNANNPVDAKFGPGDEVRCHYCGAEFDVFDRGDGRIKLKER